MAIYFSNSAEKRMYSHIIELLKEQGYPRYAWYLRDFKVRITSEVPAAAIDVAHGEILINDHPDFPMDDNTLSMLIRHELLHSLLQHQKRFLKKIYNKTDTDLSQLSIKELLDLVVKGRTPSFSFRGYGEPPIDNIAGDLDLSRYYTETDKDIIREIGGLLKDDHPEWIKLTFEEMYDKIEDQDEELLYRAAPKKFGTFDADGNFILDHEEPSDFTKDIDKQDIRGITILSPEEFNLIKTAEPILFNSRLASLLDDTWLRYIPNTVIIPDTNNPEDKYVITDSTSAPVVDGHNININKDVKDRWHVVPVLIVDNLDLYLTAHEDQWQIWDEISINGSNWIIVPPIKKINRFLLISTTYFNSIYGNNNDFMQSEIKQKLDELLNDLFNAIK